MSSNFAIQVAGLSKSYHIYDKPSHRLKQSIVSRFGRSRGSDAPRYYREFWALRDIGFEVEKGQSVGIVGRNGSGKSTLLQIICGTLAPSTGSVVTNGRIAALLELGSAFNPEFTGRENVYMNASVLGFSESETRKRFDEIVDFADIHEFIDQPVKSYSSGMRLRIAFAVQAQLEPDILIVDEALAVGDARFQAKCFARLRRLKESGTSILLVTHATEQVVTHCDSAILLDSGKQVHMGDPRQIVNQYLDLIFGRENGQKSNSESLTGMTEADTGTKAQNDLITDLGSGTSIEATSDEAFSTRPNYNPHEYRWGDGAAKIVDFKLEGNGRAYPSTLSSGDQLSIQLDIRFDRDVVRPILGITVKTKEGITVFGSNTERLNCETMKQSGRQGSTVRVTARFVCRLGAGDYFVSVGIASRGADGVIPHDRRYDAIHLNLQPTESSFGLVNMDIAMQTEALAG